MATGKKFDGDKAPIVQGCFAYFPNALKAVAVVSKFGKEKYETTYAERNWFYLDDAYNRYTDALGRHLIEPDESYDSESQLLHAAHAAWDALARLELLLDQGVGLKSGLPDLIELRNKKVVTPLCTSNFTCACGCIPF